MDRGVLSVNRVMRVEVDYGNETLRDCNVDMRKCRRNNGKETRPRGAPNYICLAAFISYRATTILVHDVQRI